MSLTQTYPSTFYSNAVEEAPLQEHRYVRLDVYVQPHGAHRAIELGWIPLSRVPSSRPSDLMHSANTMALTDGYQDATYLVDSSQVVPALQTLCLSLGIQASTLSVAVAHEPAQPVSLQQDISLGPLTSITNVLMPCRFSHTDGSVRCQVRLFNTNPEPKPSNLLESMAAHKNNLPADVLETAALASFNFHSPEGVMDILRPPTLADQQNITRQRVKGITDRGRLCKELRNAVPSHLKKRKNRRAVIKTLQDLEEYMGSIDPVFEECGNNAELCMTAARTIGLSNTRFVELRRMWEAYQAEQAAENHEVLELGSDKEACTLRKLVAILERYGWSCTSGQPRSSEDITRPPRPPSGIDSPNWMGSLRKRPSVSAFTDLVDSDDYGSDISPKKVRSEYCSSEDGNTSDEGELFPAADSLISSMFETKYANHQAFMDENFSLPTWTPRDSGSSDVPNLSFDVPDVDLFNEIEKQILAGFL